MMTRSDRTPSTGDTPLRGVQLRPPVFAGAALRRSWRWAGRRVAEARWPAVGDLLRGASPPCGWRHRVASWHVPAVSSHDALLRPLHALPRMSGARAVASRCSTAGRRRDARRASSGPRTYATSAHRTVSGGVIYAAGIGVLTMCIRLLGRPSPEGIVVRGPHH